MADKEFLLGNRARELLRYTKQATRVVTDDLSQRDARAILQKIAALEDIREVKAVTSAVIGTLDRQKEGFTKSTFRLYGQDMRDLAKQIFLDIHAANNTHFQTDAQKRLHKIDAVLDGCSLLLDYILICVEDGIITKEKAGVWTKKVTDVKYMASKWRKNDGGRARTIEQALQAEQDRRQVELVREAIRQERSES